MVAGNACHHVTWTIKIWIDCGAFSIEHNTPLLTWLLNLYMKRNLVLWHWESVLICYIFELGKQNQSQYLTHVNHRTIVS